MEMDIFEFEDDESFAKRCGDIFLTTKGNITIQCSLCDILYKSFEAYVEHLANHLYKEQTPQFKGSNQELEYAIEEYEDSEERYLVDETVQPNEETIESLDDIYSDCEVVEDEEALKEEEMPISFLKDPPLDVVIKIGTKKIEKIKKIEKNVLKKDLEIPNVVRNVNKRNFLRPPATPDIERKHKCPVCSLAFKDRNNMRQHLKRHSDVKQHGCPQCGKKFYTPTEVKIHLKSHTSERNFLCSDCGKSYKSNFQLTSHVKRHKNQRDYKCDICGKAFFDSHTLKDHMTVHSSMRPFICTVCSNSFPRRLALKNHMKLHENKREYKCKLCDAGFNQQAGLLSHMRASHKAK